MRLRFEGVTLAGDPHYETGLEEVCFELRAGELMVVRLIGDLVFTPLADAAQGLCSPEAGKVWLGEECWGEVAADREQGMRHRMGRVFEQEAWLSNLDVDENITLAERYHTDRPEAEIYAEAEALARAFGLPGLPTTRPAMTPRLDLDRCEWVRALLGSPEVVILERPGRDVPMRYTETLMKKVNEVRGRGGAAMWITNDPEVWSHPHFSQALHFVIEGSKMSSIAKP
ncbi:MAG TPA: hypothetical protein PKE55_11165 [Kiritimatiellia bacterium]|nr:hypothetical protein [Kiritimatiellia bacterium]